MQQKLLIIGLIFLTTCQTGNLKVVADLPKSLEEVSGIETSNDGNLWMVNDSGNDAELYKLDTTGNVIEVLNIAEKNTDWEDLTTDTNGNIYIGDFGNNMNDRDDLVIYKIHPDVKNEKGELSVEKIWFKFPDQSEFPPKRKNRVFDCESMFFLNDHLYLFTKSRSPKNFGVTTIYKIPAIAGHHTAIKMNSFKTCSEFKCWVTSADISPDKKTIALLAENGLWLFEDFQGDDFFSGTSRNIPFTFESQKESVCFKNDNTVYIADERGKGTGRNLYILSID